MSWFLSDFNIQAWRLINDYDPAKAATVTLIFGRSGLGKTSLLRHLYQQRGALANDILVEANTFARQYAYAAQNDKLTLFRRRYRTARLLLIDDFQFFKGKAKTIEELQNTYEALLERGGKIVAALEDDSPRLKFLGTRLSSRFLGGMVVPILPPQSKEIEAFIAEYIRRKQIYMESATVELIAERTASLADALAIIEQFVNYAKLHETDLSVLCFRIFWQDLERRSNRAAEPLNIIKTVAQYTGIPSEELVGHSRKVKTLEARELAIYVIRTLCGISYPVIAEYFKRSHSSVMASYKKMQKKLANDQELETKYKQILKMFQDIDINS